MDEQATLPPAPEPKRAEDPVQAAYDDGYADGYRVGAEEGYVLGVAVANRYRREWGEG